MMMIIGSDLEWLGDIKIRNRISFCALTRAQAPPHFYEPLIGGRADLKFHKSSDLFSLKQYYFEYI